MKTKVRWLIKAPSSYNDYLFNEITSSNKYDLVVYYEKDNLSMYPWKETVINFYKRDRSSEFLRKFNLLISALFERDIFFVVGGWGGIFPLSILFILNLRSKKYAIWVDSQNLKQKRSTLKKIVRKTLLKVIYNKAPLFLATGKMAIDNLTSDGCVDTKIINFPYAVDRSRYNKNLNLSLNKPIVFLSVGRLQLDLKGYDLAIKALYILKNSSKLEFKYFIAGDGPDRAKLSRLISELNLEKEIKLVGWLEQNEVVDFYKKGDVFLHPAIFEPYGTVVQEAISSGLLVIGSDKTGAVVDLITSGKNGYIHKTNDINDIVDKINLFLKIKDNGKVMLAESYKISDNFDAQLLINKMHYFV